MREVAELGVLLALVVVVVVVVVMVVVVVRRLTKGWYMVEAVRLVYYPSYASHAII